MGSTDYAVTRARHGFLSAFAVGSKSEGDLEGVTRYACMFEERALRRQLDCSEVLKTYGHLAGMLRAGEGDRRLPDLSKRVVLAQNFLYHAAEPENTDQGRFFTCCVTAMQEVLVSRFPSRVCAMLRQATTVGAYVAPDGAIIQLDPGAMQPVSGCDSAVPCDGVRSYATQILNHVLTNEITQRRSRPGFYWQISDGRDERGNELEPGDNGERFSYAGFDGPRATQANRACAGIDLDDLVFAMRRHSGERCRHVLAFCSVDALARDIEEAQRLRRLPIMIMVDGRYPALRGEAGPPKSEFSPHIVSICKYEMVDAQTRNVGISNQWGKEHDRTMALEVVSEMSLPPCYRKQRSWSGWPGEAI